MSLFKVTWFFTYKKAGYSFSLFETNVDINAVLGHAESFNLKTLELLGVGVTSEYIRVSDEANQGDALVRSRVIGASGTAEDGTGWFSSVIAAEDSPPDPGSVALMITLGASATAKGRMFMRLVPDSLVVRGPTFIPSVAWTLAFNRWANFLTEAPAYQIRVIPKVGIRRKSLSQTRTDAADPAHITMNTIIPNGLVVGDIVLIGGLTGALAYLNGYLGYVDGVTSPTTFTLGWGGAPFVGVVQLFQVGYVIKQSKQVFDLTRPNVAWSRIVTRKIGRPFGQPVGRRV